MSRRIRNAPIELAASNSASRFLRRASRSGTQYQQRRLLMMSVALAAGLLAVSACSEPSPQSEGTTTTAPWVTVPSAPIRHVLIVMLENKDFDSTWGPSSNAPYLSRTLAQQGTFLTNYYGIGHRSLTNYIALLSGQAPNSNTAYNCPTYRDFVPTGPLNSDGQLPGRGCVYPASLETLPDQLDVKGLAWKGYFEDMGNDPVRDGGTSCAHPEIGGTDKTQTASSQDQYATRHNPFVYFHSIIDNEASCNANVVSLAHLEPDLSNPATAPNFAMITPNLCNDGHDGPCVGTDADGHSTGGLKSINAWLSKWIPKLLASPTYQAGGTLVVVTFDEASGSDASACCNERPGPDTPLPGGTGPGGGRVGALLLAPGVQRNAKVSTPYNHYSMLRTIEDIFELPHLGFAAANGLEPLAPSIFAAN